MWEQTQFYCNIYKIEVSFLLLHKFIVPGQMTMRLFAFAFWNGTFDPWSVLVFAGTTYPSPRISGQPRCNVGGDTPMKCTSCTPAPTLPDKSRAFAGPLTLDSHCLCDSDICVRGQHIHCGLCCVFLLFDIADRNSRAFPGPSNLASHCLCVILDYCLRTQYHCYTL